MTTLAAKFKHIIMKIKIVLSLSTTSNAAIVIDAGNYTKAMTGNPFLQQRIL